MKPTSILGLQANLRPLGLLLRWLAHLVLHCSDKAQLGQNSHLQLHSWHLFISFMLSFALGVDANARPILNLGLVQRIDWSLILLILQSGRCIINGSLISNRNFKHGSLVR